MRKGTTPTHIFSLGFDAESCEEIRIIYSQDGKIKLIKEKKDAEIIEDQIKIKLTQEETFLFDVNNLVEIQLRVKIDDEILASEIMTIRVKRLLEDEVM